jgi:WhiB family redox-sensing transcriptional regulator
MSARIHGSHGSQGRPVGSTNAPKLLDSETRWQEKANCLGLDTDLFFPERGQLTLGARKVCDNCEVRTQCLEFAIAHGERWGTWGGLSETQRREFKRGRLSA